MNKPLVVGATALTLLFGGAGIANADTTPAPATTTLAQESQTEDDGDNTGLWGLTGLLGLIGLAGLARRKDANYPAANRAGTAVPPRA